MYNVKCVKGYDNIIQRKGKIAGFPPSRPSVMGNEGRGWQVRYWNPKKRQKEGTRIENENKRKKSEKRHWTIQAYKQNTSSLPNRFTKEKKPYQTPRKLHIRSKTNPEKRRVKKGGISFLSNHIGFLLYPSRELHARQVHISPVYVARPDREWETNRPSEEETETVLEVCFLACNLPDVAHE